MVKVLVIANRKGGCAKSTTAVNLGIGLARRGKKALIIDADSQHSLNWIGFVFTGTPFVGVDIDHCIKDGKAPKEINEIISMFGSYPLK